MNPQSQVLSVEKIREIDRRAVEEFHIPSIVLMENAARGCVDLLLRHRESTASCTILCGKGNNAGDGLAMARHLELRGVEVTVVLTMGDQFSGDALTNYQICVAAGISLLRWQDKSADAWEQFFSEQTWLVDALLGTGATGDPRGPLDEVIRTANEAPARRIAVDTPTGLNCETGEVADACFCADITGTFVAIKPGFQSSEARRVLGNVSVLDIGAPQKLVNSTL